MYAKLFPCFACMMYKLNTLESLHVSLSGHTTSMTGELTIQLKKIDGALHGPCPLIFGIQCDKFASLLSS